MKRVSTKQYLYLGHTIESDHELPELPPAPKKAAAPCLGITVSTDRYAPQKKRAWRHQWRSATGSVTLQMALTEKGFYLSFPGQSGFFIEGDGKHVICCPGGGIALATRRHLLLDQVLPRLFAHFYGYGVFHGACVARHQEGFCFMGDTGWGKSTLAAGLSSHGFRGVTDDCLRLHHETGQLWGTPSYGGLRLWPDSLAELDAGLSGAGESERARWGKHRICPSHHSLAPVALRAIFLLTDPGQGGKREQPEMIPVTKGDAVKALLQNSFSLDVHDAPSLKRQFLHISELAAAQTPLYALHYTREFSAIADICRLLETILDGREHARGLQ